MPYKDINKRRLCNKLAMRRARAKKSTILEQTYENLRNREVEQT